MQVGFETEGTAIYDTMQFVKNEVRAGQLLSRISKGIFDRCYDYFNAAAPSLIGSAQVHTVGVGVAMGQACMLLSAGHKGKRFMLPHATGGQYCKSFLHHFTMLPLISEIPQWRSILVEGRNTSAFTEENSLCCFSAMLQQPRVPPTGQRQAIEIQIKWKEVLAQKQALLRILSKTTGHSTEKLDYVSVLTYESLKTL